MPESSTMSTMMTAVVALRSAASANTKSVRNDTMARTTRIMVNGSLNEERSRSARDALRAWLTAFEP